METIKTSSTTGFANTDSNINSPKTTSGTSTTNFWSNPERLEVNEYVDKIEIIYKQTSALQLATYPPRPPEERVFKIVFSCIDGKWNKSEPIYGKIIRPQSEKYQF